jgi:hypothetical protein
VRRVGILVATGAGVLIMLALALAGPATSQIFPTPTTRTIRTTTTTAPSTTAASSTTVPQSTTATSVKKTSTTFAKTSSTAATTSSSSTTSTTLGSIPGGTAPPSTLPLQTKATSAHVSPVFPVLSGIGATVVALMLALQWFLTRPGRKGWTL